MNETFDYSKDFSIPVTEILLAMQLIVGDRGLGIWENKLPTLFKIWDEYGSPE